MPGLRDLLTNNRDGDEIEPECTCLYLPSDFSLEERHSRNISELGEIELKLREGEANDAKRMLRTQINLKISLDAQRRVHSRGTKDTTRASKVLHDTELEKKFLATVYRAARSAIVSLGGDGVKAYPPLTDKDMVPKSQKAGRDAGAGKETESWLFGGESVHPEDAKAMAEWEVESESLVRTHNLNAHILRQSCSMVPSESGHGALGRRSSYYRC
jgi:hypothetical protein